MDSRAWGIILVVLGGALLLGSMGYGGISWDAVWRLWPALLIYAGLVRLFRYLGYD